MNPSVLHPDEIEAERLRRERSEEPEERDTEKDTLDPMHMDDLIPKGARRE